MAREHAYVSFIPLHKCAAVHETASWVQTVCNIVSLEVQYRLATRVVSALLRTILSTLRIRRHL